MYTYTVKKCHAITTCVLIFQSSDNKQHAVSMEPGNNLPARGYSATSKMKQHAVSMEPGKLPVLKAGGYLYQLTESDLQREQEAFKPGEGAS